MFDFDMGSDREWGINYECQDQITVIYFNCDEEDEEHVLCFPWEGGLNFSFQYV